MNAVTVKNLTKVFRQGDEDIYAVDHVSFTVAPGEMVAIVGQSGSGKTTLLNLIGGIEHSTSGSVEVDGVDICSSDDETLSGIRRRKLGYIFQDFNLIPILTAEENIIMPLLLDGKKPQASLISENQKLTALKSAGLLKNTGIDLEALKVTAEENSQGILLLACAGGAVLILLLVMYRKRKKIG